MGDTGNSIFQKARDSLISKLIEFKEIKGTYLTFDSSNIPVKVKENNLKTSIKNRFDKNKRPKGDPESRLSIMVHFPKPFQKEIKYFWGYRNFVLSDSLSELPILVETKPANVVDNKVIISQLKFAKDRFDLSICAVIVDSGLDSTKVLNFIICDLQAKPYIARNLRREKDHKISSTDNRIYLAVFEIWSRTYLLSWSIPSLPKVQVVLLTLKYLAKISANRLLMALRNLKKYITSAVDVKGYFPGYLTFICKIQVAEDSRLSLITVLLPILPFFWLPWPPLRQVTKIRFVFFKSFLPNI